MSKTLHKSAGGLLLVCLPTASLGVVILAGYLVLWPAWQESQLAKSLADALYANDSNRLNEAVAAIRKMKGGVAAIPVLVKGLKEGDERVRMLSAETLGEFGAVANEAVPHLIEAEADENEGVRRLSANSIGKVGKPAVPRLIQALKHPNEEVRGWSAEALGKVGPEASEAIAALAAVAADEAEPSFVRRDAVLALVSIDLENTLAVDTIWNALKFGDEATRNRIGLAISGNDPQGNQFVKRCLIHESAHVRTAGTHALGYMGRTYEKPMPPELLQSLEDVDGGVRAAAACQLGMLHSRAVTALPRLKKAMADEDSRVRARAARAVWQITEQNSEAIPVLIEAVEDSRNSERGIAAQTLSEIGLDAEVAIPALVEALRQRDQHAKGDCRWHIALALGSFGALAKEALPTLVDILRDKDATGRQMIAIAIGDIGSYPELAVPALVDALKDSDVNVRRGAAEALGKFGAAAKTATSRLRQCLEDSDWRVRNEASTAIERIEVSLDDVEATSAKSVP